MDVIPSEAAIAAPQSLRGLESVGLNTTNTTKDFFERMLSERRHPLQTIRVIFSWWDEVNFMRSVINPNLRKLTVIMEHRILPVDFVQGTERLDRIGISDRIATSVAPSPESAEIFSRNIGGDVVL